MVGLVTRLQATQDGDRVLDRWFVDEYGHETTGKRRVAFNVLAVFVERGRTNTVEFATGESWLQEV